MAAVLTAGHASPPLNSEGSTGGLKGPGGTWRSVGPSLVDRADPSRHSLDPKVRTTTEQLHGEELAAGPLSEEALRHLHNAIRTSPGAAIARGRQPIPGRVGRGIGPSKMSARSVKESVPCRGPAGPTQITGPERTADSRDSRVTMGLRPYARWAPQSSEDGGGRRAPGHEPRLASLACRTCQTFSGVAGMSISMAP